MASLKRVGSSIRSRNSGHSSHCSSQELSFESSHTPGRFAYVSSGNDPVVKDPDNNGNSLTNMHKGLSEVQERGSYKLVMGLIIILNIAMMVSETDIQAKGEPLPFWMKVVSSIFFVIYVIDLFLTVYSYREQFCFSIMNMLDLAIVSIDVVFLFTADVTEDLPAVTVLKTFRILRVVKVLNNALAFRELYLMMQGLILSLRSIAFGTALTGLMLTVWSIVAVAVVHPRNKMLSDEGVYGDCGEWCRDAFSTVMRSNLTFFQTIISGDSWGLMAIPLITTYPSTALIIIPAFLTVEVGLLNVIAAVIVDRQHQARVNDDSLKHAEHLESAKRSYGRLQAMFNKMDEDSGGSLTKEELIDAWDSQPDFREMLEIIDIAKDDLPVVFEILDMDGSGDVTYQEFVEKLHYIRHINAHTLLVFMQTHIKKLLRNSNSSMEQLALLTEASRRPPEAVESTEQKAPSSPRSSTSTAEELLCMPSGMELQTLPTSSLIDERWKPGQFCEPYMEQYSEVATFCHSGSSSTRAAEPKADVHPGPKLLPITLQSKRLPVPDNFARGDRLAHPSVIPIALPSKRLPVPENFTRCDRCLALNGSFNAASMLVRGHREDVPDIGGNTTVHAPSRCPLPAQEACNPVELGTGGGYGILAESTTVSHQTWKASLSEPIHIII